MENEKVLTPEVIENVEIKAIETYPVEDIDRKLANVDKVFELLGKLRQFALKHLSPKSITNEGGNPYITESGVNVFDSPFGIYEKDVSGIVVKENGVQISIDDANAFSGTIECIIYRGIVGSKTLGIEASFEGGTYFADTEAGQKDRKFHDKEDYLFFSKKAKANWRGRARRKLLGLDNITWDELAKYGITPDNCTSVSRKSSQAPVSAEQTQTDNKLRGEITMWLAEFITDAAGRSNKLEEMTSFKGSDGNIVPGLRDPKNLSGKRLEIAHQKAKVWYEETKSQWGAK